MREMLCSKDSYLKEFDASIVKNYGQEVVLDQTAFYYTSGGQPNDTGKLVAEGKEYPVVDVYRQKETGEIRHKLKEEMPSHIHAVHGVIDWKRRYGHMRHHTALHVLSRVVLDAYNALVTGSQIYEERARMDFSLAELNDEQVKFMEEKANQAIAKGFETAVHFIAREEALQNPELIRTQINLVPESVKTIRCIEIKGFDLQACGGTHVKNTKEIGSIKITNVESKGQGKRRVELVAENP